MAVPLADASLALGRYAEAVAGSPLQAALAADLCRREATASSRLQGFAVTAEALLQRIDDPHGGRPARALIVAFDLYRALQSVVRGDPDRHLSGSGLAALEHRATALGRGAAAAPAQLSAAQRLACEHALNAADEPPAPLVAPALPAIGTAVRALGRAGNPRLARLLVPVLLRRRGLCGVPGLMISAALVRRRARYRHAWDGPGDWPALFVEAVGEEATVARRRLRRLQRLRARFGQRCAPQRRSSRIEAALDLVLRQPVFSVYGLQRDLQVSYRGAQTLIERLAAGGVVVEITGRQRDRLFCVPELVDPAAGVVDESVH